MNNLLKIANRFVSVDGETSFGGPLQFSNFIRLGGCNLRCWGNQGFCDAPFSISKDSERYDLAIPEQLAQEYNEQISKKELPNRFTITGGEPLLQSEVLNRFFKELDRGTNPIINIETNGSQRIDLIRRRMNQTICFVIDIKMPSSGMHKRMKLALNKDLMIWPDILKVVVETEDDLEYFEKIYSKFDLKESRVAVGPKYDPQNKISKVTPERIVKFLMDRKMFSVRLNLQLHKYIWPYASPYFVSDPDKIPEDQIEHMRNLDR